MQMERKFHELNLTRTKLTGHYGHISKHNTATGVHQHREQHINFCAVNWVKANKQLQHKHIIVRVAF